MTAFGMEREGKEIFLHLLRAEKPHMVSGIAKSIRKKSAGSLRSGFGKPCRIS